MKTNIATDRSQSERLLRCGVSADTADMSYDSGALSLMDYDSAVHERDSRRENYEVTPAWSLGALLSNVLPKHLDDFPFTQWIQPFSDGEICEMEGNDECVLNGDVTLSCGENAWVVDYDWDGFTGVLPNADNPIEACVRAIELLHANGYKFNEQ